MSRRDRGISDHELVYMFELFNQKLLACGVSPREAEHHALYCTFRLGGMTHAEARADAKAIFPLDHHQGDLAP